jgi:hypothetical protein
MTQPCTQIGAFAGLRWVKETERWVILEFAGCSALAGQRPATCKELLRCYLRWDEIYRFLLLFHFAPPKPFSSEAATLLSSGLWKGMWCISWWSQTGPSKCWDWESIMVLYSPLPLSENLIFKDNTDFHTLDLIYLIISKPIPWWLIQWIR